MDLEGLKEEVRARADIVDVVGSSVKLVRAGDRYKGLCPFHQEKTPSFTVSSKHQTFHCFGCGAGGDVFKFVMDHEKVDFMGALERLAGRVGVPFEFDKNRQGSHLKKQRLYELHNRSTEFFEKALLAPQGVPALDYTREREIAPEMLKAFRVGLAPDSFSQLLTAARDWGFNEEELEASGLFGERERPRNGEKRYDRFRNRLMFPILDEQERVIGFSGRVLPGNDSKAKYVNSPETLLFKKSRVLYGIHLARRPMADSRRAVLCEGQLDVIRCHEAGIQDAVAAQGTAVTAEHATVLKRYADEVVLLLDADSAGIKAALRSAEALLSESLSIKVASLPEGEDPDSIVLRKGPKALIKVLDEAEPFIRFQIKTLLKQEGELSDAVRLRVARAVMENIARVPEAVHQESLIQQASSALGLSPEALRHDLPAPKSKAAPSRPSPPSRPRPSSPSTGYEEYPPEELPPPDFGYPEQEQPQVSSSQKSYPRKKGFSRKDESPQPPPPRPHIPKPQGLDHGPRLLFAFLFHHPNLIQNCKDWLQPSQLPEQAGTLLAACYALEDPGNESLMDALREQEGQAELTRILHEAPFKFSPDLGKPEDQLRELLVHLRRDMLQQRLKSLKQQARNEPSRAAEFEADIWRLTLGLSKVQELIKARAWEQLRQVFDLIDQVG